MVKSPASFDQSRSCERIIASASIAEKQAAPQAVRGGERPDRGGESQDLVRGDLQAEHTARAGLKVDYVQKGRLGIARKMQAPHRKGRPVLQAHRRFLQFAIEKERDDLRLGRLARRKTGVRRKIHAAYHSADCEFRQQRPRLGIEQPTGTRASSQSSGKSTTRTAVSAVSTWPKLARSESTLTSGPPKLAFAERT